MLGYFDNIDTSQNVYLFGAGTQGEIFVRLAELYRSDINILGFVDNNRRGSLLGHEVMSMEGLLARDLSSPLIVITSSFWQEIAGQLASYGIVDFVLFKLFAPKEQIDFMNDSHFIAYSEQAASLKGKPSSPYEHIGFYYRREIGGGMKVSTNTRNPRMNINVRFFPSGSERSHPNASWTSDRSGIICSG